MKTNLPIILNEEGRARVRAALGRGGLATRKEIRIFANSAIRQALEAAPEPKRRRRAPAAAEPFVAATSDQRICVNCRQAAAEHDRGKYCRVSRLVKPGSRFTPVAGETAEAGR